MNDQLKQVQEITYQMLIEFDAFCQEHHLTYFLSYGSLLGAVRHGGFIPWDDDMDVCMPREDFDKLFELAEQLPKHFKLCDYRNSDNTAGILPWIANKNTTVIFDDKYRCLTLRGVYFDIFPIDGMGNTEAQAKKQYRQFSRISLLANISNFKIEYWKKRNPLKRITAAYARLRGEKKLKAQLQKTLRRYAYNDSVFVASLLSPYSAKETMPKSVYGIPSKVKFNDHYFNAPQDPHAYLTQIYGDYMTPPPPEKRIGHDSRLFVDLNTPYEEFDFEGFKREQAKIKAAKTNAEQAEQ